MSQQLDGCGAETRRIDGEFDTLCQNINSFRGEIAKTVEKMNVEDQKTIEKTQRKLEDVNARILAYVLHITILRTYICNHVNLVSKPGW